VTIIPVTIAEPDVFGDYFDDGMKLVDISQDAALRSCLSDGKTADKTKAAYDGCYGQGYDFDDLAKAGGDDDGLPDELEEKEGCFYKKMGWVSEDNVMDEAAIAADMEGLENQIQEGFLTDVKTCIAWSGNFGERRKREAGMEVQGETRKTQDKELVPGLMDTGSRAMGWVRKLVRNVRSPGNGGQNGGKNNNAKGKGKGKAGKDKRKVNRSKRRRGGKTKKNKGNGKPPARRRARKTKKNKGKGKPKNENKPKRRRGGKTNRNNGKGNRAKRRRGGRAKKNKGNGKKNNENRPSRRRGGKGKKNKGKGSPNNENGSKRRRGGKSKKNNGKGSQNNGDKPKRNGRGKEKKKKEKDSNKNNPKERKTKKKNDQSLPEAVYNKLWCIDLAIEQALEKCVEAKILN